MAVNIKKIVIGSIMVIVGIPVLVALVTFISYQIVNRTNGTLVSSGEKREYLLHVPESYDSARPTPLVISMHGTGLWPRNQMATTGWNTIADEYGIIIVYPAAAGFPRMWRFQPSDNQNEKMSEFRFIADLIDTLEQKYNIDPTRIYAGGLSAGGTMALMLSCYLPDRIAAIGTVGAPYPPWDWCENPNPVPLIAFHGTADELAPYDGGTSWAVSLPLPSVRTWIANWAQKNNCLDDVSESMVATDIIRMTYGDCKDDATVVLYTIKEGGHTWPGGRPFPEWMGGRTTDSINATKLMWAFFREHPLVVD